VKIRRDKANEAVDETALVRMEHYYLTTHFPAFRWHGPDKNFGVLTLATD